jgi:hypothetical protein
MDVTGNPFIINAADVAGLAAIAGSGNNPGDVVQIGGIFYKVVWKGQVPILQIEFMQYAAATDTAVIDRYNTKNLWDAHGSSDFETVRSGGLGFCDGILVPNNGITAGVIKVYHR